jgi:hypothetical protein
MGGNLSSRTFPPEITEIQVKRTEEGFTKIAQHRCVAIA